MADAPSSLSRGALQDVVDVFDSARAAAIKFRDAGNAGICHPNSIYPKDQFGLAALVGALQKQSGASNRSLTNLQSAIPAIVTSLLRLDGPSSSSNICRRLLEPSEFGVLRIPSPRRAPGSRRKQVLDQLPKRAGDCHPAALVRLVIEHIKRKKPRKRFAPAGAFMSRTTHSLCACFNWATSYSPTHSRGQYHRGCEA